MSVTITITDPSSTPPEELQAVIAMLRGFAPSMAAPEQDKVAFGNEARALPPPAVIVPPPPPVFVVEGVPPAEEVKEAAAQGAREAFAPPPEQHAHYAAVPEEKMATLFPPSPVKTFIGGVELDKDGIPWDGRIHASTKTKTVEGVWKKKRGIEPALVDEVTAELRAVMAVPTPPAAVGSDPTPPAPPAPPVPPVPPAATGVSFAEFMGHVTAGVTSARFTREEVSAACVKSGVPNLPGLINRPDLIPAVARELGLMA